MRSIRENGTLRMWNGHRPTLDAVAPVECPYDEEAIALDDAQARLRQPFGQMPIGTTIGGCRRGTVGACCIDSDDDRELTTYMS